MAVQDEVEQDGNQVAVAFCCYDNSNDLKYWSHSASFSCPKEQRTYKKTYEHTIRNMYQNQKAFLKL